MTNEHSGDPSAAGQLPRELGDRLKRPFTLFFRVHAAGGGALVLCSLVALGVANSPWAHAYAAFWETRLGVHAGELVYARSLHGWINDGAMTLFFFLVALALKKELVLGDLRNPRMAALPIAAAIGGMLVPAGLFLAVMSGLPGSQGWGTVMTTDTAFVIGCLALLGSRVPKSLSMFMLSLAIVDDIGAMLVVAFGYSGAIDWHALGWAAGGLALLQATAWAGIRGFPVYFALGSFIWVAVDASGVHATATGVVLGLMTPARRWVTDDRLYAILDQVVAHPTAQEHGGETRDRKTLQIAEIAARETLSPVERLEMALHPWVSFVILPLFALSNAGMTLGGGQSAGTLTLAVVLGAVVGKPLGVLAFAWLAMRSGLALSAPGLAWRHMLGGSLLAGIGFTMALFIANLAFDPAHLYEAKLGILCASLCAAVAGLAVLWWPSRRSTP